METCDVIVCDVDGVINVFADDGFLWNDMQDKRLVVDGKPGHLFTFSPTVANELSQIASRFPFHWLTSWNDKTNHLQQLGFPQADVLHVEKGREFESKLEHVTTLARKQKILWIDDFACEWQEFLPEEIRTNVFCLQPDHRQGLTEKEIQQIKTLCRLD